MNKLLLTPSFLMSFIFLASYSWALPPCPKKGYKHNCYGIFTYPSGNKFEGEFRNNVYNGYGIKTFASGGKFEGEYKDHKRNGKGVDTFSNGDQFVGNYKDNKKNGKGSYIWFNGDKYEGEWKDDKKHGQGIATFANGKTVKGFWQSGEYITNSDVDYGTSTSNSKIEGYKSFCSEIGFTPGTDKYGECVVEAMKKGLVKNE